jgi:hypothetical protein
MNARIAISSSMNLQQASTAISTLPTDVRLQFKVKTDASGVKTLHVRPLSNTEKIKLKLTGGYSINQKKAAFELIKAVVETTYNNADHANRTNPDVKNMLKLKAAITWGVSLSKAEEGVRVRPSLTTRAGDQFFKLLSKINPSKIGKGLDF